MQGAGRALLSRFWVQDLVRDAGYGPLSISDTIHPPVQYSRIGTILLSTIQFASFSVCVLHVCVHFFFAFLSACLVVVGV